MKRIKLMGETTGGRKGPIQIDLTGIIRSRLGSRGRFIPSFLLRLLENLICQDRMNEVLRKVYPARGSRFSEAVLQELDIKLDVFGSNSLSEDEKYVFVSNHPLGGLDGIALVKVLGEKYGDDDVRVIVNDLLMHVDPLKDVFVPVNKYGGQGRSGATAINEAFEVGKQILIFPAGLVSRLQPGGRVADLEWKKMFLVKALEYNRKVVPVRFEGLNRMRFYRTALWRKRLGIGVNLEQALLPSELCNSTGRQYKIFIGAPIDVVSMLREGYNQKDIIAEVRKIQESLGN